MLTNIVLLGLLTTTPTPRVPLHGAFTVRPRIEVWSNHGDGVYNRGQGVRVYIRSDQDGFVTLFRVDTDGRVRVLFPRDPSEDNFVRGGRDFEILSSDNSTAFYIDDYPGVGYLFGVVAADPFDYAAIESGDHWDYRTIADGRVRGDPYVALTELAERIVPEGYADWDYDIVPYHVQQHYEYPRFLCYDCHAYASYPYWDPYWASCVRFRIVYYDDPYYYPYRYYGAGRVVFTRPYRPLPRYVFKDRDGSGRDRFVSRETTRPVNDDTRRAAPDRRTVTTGYIPAPRTRPQPVNGGGATAARRDGDQDGTNRDQARGAANGRSSTDNPSGETRRAPREGQPRGTRVPVDQTRTTDGAPRRGAPLREVSPDQSRGSGRAEKPRGESSRAEPRGSTQREQPRAEPRGSTQREQPRAEPRGSTQREQPRAEPRPSQREPRAEPRAAPQREPRADPPRSEPKSSEGQPELRRRQPD